MGKDFQAGYEAIRPCSDLEKQPVPLLAKLSRLWNHYDVARFMSLMDEELTDDHLHAFTSELEQLS